MDACDTKPEWSSLPEDIVHKILCKLPLFHLQRARIVCSAWNRLLSDSTFLSLRRAYPPPSLPGFALFLSDKSSSQLFYLDLQEPSQWRRISLSFLPFSGANSTLLASSGGFLLLGTNAGDLIVANPITRQWRQLPPRESIRKPFYTALMADVLLGGFAVAVAESELHKAAETEIYDSKTGRWRAGAKPARAGRWKRVASPMSTPWFNGSVPVYCNPVYCGGAFYHLTWDLEEIVSELNLGEGVWRCAKGTAAVLGGALRGVMEDKGKVVLLEMSYVTKQMKAEAAMAGANAVIRSYGGEAMLSLWELQRDSLKWVKTRRIPQPPNSEYRVEKWRRFAVGEGFLCMTFVLSGTVVTCDSQANPQPGMIYDCGRAMWLPMPDLPGIPWGNISSLFGYTASFNPVSE